MLAPAARLRRSTRSAGAARSCCERTRRSRRLLRGPHAVAGLRLPLRADRDPGASSPSTPSRQTAVWDGLHARLVPPPARQRALFRARAQQPGGGAWRRPRSPTVLGTPAALALAPLPASAGGGPPRRCSICRSIIPEIVLGAALVTFFGAAGMRLSLSTVVIAHVVFSVSYVAIVVRARLAGLDPALEEAARGPRRRPLRDLPPGDPAARSRPASSPAPCSSSPSRSTTT